MARSEFLAAHAVHLPCVEELHHTLPSGFYDAGRAGIIHLSESRWMDVLEGPDRGAGRGEEGRGGARSVGRLLWVG